MRALLSYPSSRNFLFIASHAIFWVLFILIPHIAIGIPFQYTFLEFKIFETIILMALFYVNAYFFVPKLLLAKKYLAYILVLAVFIFGGMELSKQFLPPKMPRNIVAIDLDNHELNQAPTNHIQKFENKHFENLRLDKKFKRMEQKRANFMGLLLLIIFSVSTGYRYALQMYSYEKTMKELQNANLESELQLLKSQINPHFLFNTLNSIYSLSLKKSDLTPKAILQVSEMLRYITYDTDEQFVPIQKEIAYIQNYIALQKLRVSSNSTIDFSVIGEPAKVTIAPMLLLPFIENACKHGISPDGTLSIAVNLLINNNMVCFTIHNTVFVVSKSSENKGIGIENVQRRLNALYQHKHTLQIEQTADTYNVTLSIHYT